MNRKKIKQEQKKHKTFIEILFPFFVTGVSCMGVKPHRHDMLVKILKVLMKFKMLHSSVMVYLPSNDVNILGRILPIYT